MHHRWNYANIANLLFERSRTPGNHFQQVRQQNEAMNLKFLFFSKVTFFTILSILFLRVNKNKWITRGKWSWSTYFCWFQRKCNTNVDYRHFSMIPNWFSESIHINSQSLKFSCKMVVYHPVLAAVGHFPSCHSRSGHAYPSPSPTAATNIFKTRFFEFPFLVSCFTTLLFWRI